MKSKTFFFFTFLFIILEAIVSQNVHAECPTAATLRGWADTLKHKISLCQQDISQGAPYCYVIVNWEGNRQVSVSEAENLAEQYLREAQKLEASVLKAPNKDQWVCMWPIEDKKSVDDTIRGFKDKKIRDWLAKKEFKRERDPGQQKLSPWAGSSGLIFANDFFNPKKSNASKISLTAFEGGKVFYSAMGGSQTFVNWWMSYNDNYYLVISKMKTAKYQHDDLSSDDLSYIVDLPGQYDSGFGYLFRALALGLKWDTPKGQEAKEEFKNRVYPLLQK